MKEEACQVVHNARISEGYYLMKIRSPYIAGRCKPGNFVMIAVTGGTDPLLKRPFGIFRTEGDMVEVYYEVVGKGSRLLAGKRNGDTVMVVGPLGNSFPETEGEDILLVAGGRGIAPLYFAAEAHSRSNNMSLVYGARSEKDLLFTRELGELPLKEMKFFTDDGSAFQRGTIVTGIRDMIERNRVGITFACGPDRMFESLHREIGGLGTDNFVSLEAFMGCGFGICHSCVVMGSDGKYKKVCTDGPVFKMEDIRWQT